MTANLTVPADVWACQPPGVPLVAAIVEGELETGFYFGPDRFNPPAWLVALRDARCDSSVHLKPDRWCIDNDRCVDGRLLHDVRVECDGDCQPQTGRYFNRLVCHGYRTVRCLVDVVEVRRDYTDHGSPAVVVMCEPMVSAGRVFWVAADGSSSVALTPAHVDALAAACGKPPADWVGGYAVILTEVGE